MLKWLTHFSKKSSHQMNNDDASLHVTIAGLQYYRGNDLGDWVQVGDAVTLIPEPKNKHDPNAIMIFWQENKLGYLPKSLASLLHEWIINDSLKAEVLELSALRFGRKWIKLRIIPTDQSYYDTFKELLQSIALDES